MNSERPFLIGLTGSIGMGKSTTARFFRDAGVEVWDADAAVHRIYGPGGAGVPEIENLVPHAVAQGTVHRDILRDAVTGDPDLLPRIEAVIHPLVQADRAQFISSTSSDIVLCDIPLLFETGDPAAFDAIVVVSAPFEVQRERVLARPGMTETAFQAILDRQMTDAEKRARADYIVETDQGLDHARMQVTKILEAIRAERNA